MRRPAWVPAGRGQAGRDRRSGVAWSLSAAFSSGQITPGSGETLSPKDLRVWHTSCLVVHEAACGGSGGRDR